MCHIRPPIKVNGCKWHLPVSMAVLVFSHACTCSASSAEAIGIYPSMAIYSHSLVSCIRHAPLSVHTHEAYMSLLDILLQNHGH